jgi:hypothetical protein
MEERIECFLFPERVRYESTRFLLGGGMVNTTRWLMVATLGMLGCSWAQAASLPPTDPNFQIYLNGWDDLGSSFLVTSSTTDTYTGEGSGWSQNSLEFCPSSDWEECVCYDPAGRLQLGPDATPFNGTATIPEDNTVTEDYFNATGEPIESILITVTITNVDEDFTCQNNVDPSAFCGFKIITPLDASTDSTLELLFTDMEIFPSAVPEPRQYALLLIAFGGLILAHRFRSRRRAA